MPKRWMCLTVLLAMLTAACAQGGDGVETAVETGSAQTDPTHVAGASQDESATPTGAPSAPAENAQGESDEGAEAEADPTMDPAMEAFYAEFSLPEKGDPSAQVVLYEFSDYT